MFERKFFAERVRRFTDQLENTLYDAYQRITEERDGRGLPQATADEINVYSWPQTWPDARHGFPHEGFDKRLTVQTHVVKDEELDVVWIYHGGRLAARVEQPGKPFWGRVVTGALPGANEGDAWKGLGGDVAS
ncbi:MAG TPA: hypothetical protein VMN78_12765 [Longimicrobiales bacterium]|nr:hypothetical protein [Longimicrobiales bacterium]